MLIGRGKREKVNFRKCKNEDYPGFEGNEKYYPLAKSTKMRKMPEIWPELFCFDETINIS